MTPQRVQRLWIPFGRKTVLQSMQAAFGSMTLTTNTNLSQSNSIYHYYTIVA
jgi:hypothetical protein